MKICTHFAINTHLTSQRDAKLALHLDIARGGLQSDYISECAPLAGKILPNQLVQPIHIIFNIS